MVYVWVGEKSYPLPLPPSPPFLPAPFPFQTTDSIASILKNPRNIFDQVNAQAPHEFTPNQSTSLEIRAEYIEYHTIYGTQRLSNGILPLFT